MECDEISSIEPTEQCEWLSQDHRKGVELFEQVLQQKEGWTLTLLTAEMNEDEVVPHDALAGLFGRPPRVKLALQFVGYTARRPHDQADQSPVLAFFLAVANVGSILAEQVFVSAWWGEAGGARFRASQKNQAYVVRTSAFPGAQAVAADGILLAPGGVDEVIEFVINLPENPQSDIAIRVMAGARNSEPEICWIRASAADLQVASERTRRESFNTAEVLILSAEKNE